METIHCSARSDALVVGTADLVCPVVLGLVCYSNLNASGKSGEGGVCAHE